MADSRCTPSFYTRGCWVTMRRQETSSRSQSCSEAELQLQRAFQGCLVIPRRHPWRESDIYWGCFLVVLVCTTVSLWGPCPDVPSWTLCVRPLSLPGPIHDANCGCHEGWHRASLNLFLFLIQVSRKNPVHGSSLEDAILKEEVKLLTVEWKVMRVPFPFSLSLR